MCRVDVGTDTVTRSPQERCVNINFVIELKNQASSRKTCLPGFL